MEPFDHRITKDGKVLISRGGRLVVTLAGAKAARVIALLGRDEDSDQQVLARATGNYRRGNERTPGRP
ncbi:MAG: hypothetical protein JNL54_17505 [Kineosporiaceae bacterium]|nr:hypothetical protein [Kineosporiaceae bacterium]